MIHPNIIIIIFSVWYLLKMKVYGIHCVIVTTNATSSAKIIRFASDSRFSSRPEATMLSKCRK